MFEMLIDVNSKICGVLPINTLKTSLNELARHSATGV